MTTAAEALVGVLTDEGTEFMFGIPGTHNLGLLDEVRKTPSIRFILTRHEQAAGFMCLGYAAVSGRPGVVTATEGPGATNLATPLAAAFKAEVPVIAISGTANRQMIGRNAAQDIDQQAMYKPITRWAASVPAGSNMPEFIRKAFREALGQHRGPVHLDVSREILHETSSWSSLQPHQYRAVDPPSCSETSIDRAFELLQRSERPIILTGAELMHEGGGQSLIELAEALNIPVVTNNEHRDAFPTTHRLSLGALGTRAWPPTLRAVAEADLILVVGGKLDVGTTRFTNEILPPNVSIVYNTKNQDIIGNVFPVDLAAIGSVNSFVDGLLERTRSHHLQKNWLNVEASRKEAQLWLKSQQESPSSPIKVPAATKVLRGILSEDAIICLDAGNATKHVATNWDTYEPLTIFHSAEFGCVGSGMPTAIGAKLAAPTRQVVAAVGDMGFTASISELETCVRENINLVVVVLNDHGLGNEKAFQDAWYGGRHFAVEYRNLDFAEIARSFGAHGERVERLEEFGPALESSLSSGKPAVIDVQIDPTDLAPVTFNPSR